LQILPFLSDNYFGESYFLYIVIIEFKTNFIYKFLI